MGGTAPTPACLVVSSRRSGCRFKACGNMAIRLTITVTTAPRKGSELAQLYKAPRTQRRVVLAGVDRWRERCVMVDNRCSLPAALLRSLSNNLQSFLAIAYRLPRLE